MNADHFFTLNDVGPNSQPCLPQANTNTAFLHYFEAPPQPLLWQSGIWGKSFKLLTFYPQIENEGVFNPGERKGRLGRDKTTGTMGSNWNYPFANPAHLRRLRRRAWQGSGQSPQLTEAPAVRRRSSVLYPSSGPLQPLHRQAEDPCLVL